MMGDEVEEEPTFANGITTISKAMEVFQDGWDFNGLLTAQGQKKKPVPFLTPRLNLLMSTTPDIFAQTFPANNVNTHLLSQLIVVNGGNPRKKIAWPLPYNVELLKRLKEELHKVGKLRGEMTFSDDAKKFLTVSYNNWIPISDSRLMAYASKRQLQLIKIAMLVAAENYTLHIGKTHVVTAAKILAFAEAQMPVALGEYGIDRQSHIRGRIMHLLNSRFPETSTMGDIYKAVQQDVKNYTEVADLVNSLILAGKIVASRASFAPVNQTGFTEQEGFSMSGETLWEAKS